MGLRIRARNDRPPVEADDARMLRLASGDPEALRELMEAHGEAVLNFLYRMLGDRAAAEDLTQESFLRVYRGAASYRPGQGLRPWIFAIARNLALNGMRRPRPAPLAETADRSPGPAASLENGELQRRIDHALQQIEEPFRGALVLCVLEGLSYEEAAEVCGCAAKTLSSRLARARARFRALMNPYLNGNGNEKL